jgi:hypothetical protein
VLPEDVGRPERLNRRQIGVEARPGVRLGGLLVRRHRKRREPGPPRRTLVPGSTLHIEATTDAKVNVTLAPHCRELPTPADCVVAPGTYLIELVVQGAKITRNVRVTADDRTEKFDLGFVEPAAGKQLLFGGQKLKRLALEAGPRIVTILDEAGQRQVSVRVKAGATVTAN